MNGTFTLKQAQEFAVVYKDLQRLTQETLKCEMNLVGLLGIESHFQPGPSYTALMTYTPETFLEACGIKIQDTGEESNG